ncbi:unnamed protein product [Brassicogethes aeneus]|uniref:Uncharacterized protein n=1 Tax=Brassicogethes aeneus TaxID=1431903 RepID=A0A9P0B851_BRAAE|nr:unnamed protein product [Brassicogethes aeneus]
MALNLRLLYQLVQTEALSIPHQIFSKLQSILDNKKLKPLDVLRYLAPTCEESLQRCRWKGEEKRCDIIFQMIPTSQGFCCAFNYFAMRNPIYPGFYRNLSYKSPKLPRRVSACGYQTGLEILLSNDPNNYFLTGIPSIGHSVLIHNSYYFPASSVQTVLTENRLLNHIDIVPSLTYSTNSLKELDIEKRNCLLFNERKLPNFEGYTYHNCIVESMIHGSVELAQKNVENKCNCLPDCEYVEYIAQTSSGRLMSQYATNPNNL